MDRLIRIHELHTGQFVTALQGHKDSVYSAAFSADGKWLVSGSLDTTCKIWDVSRLIEGHAVPCVHTLIGHRVNFKLSFKC